MGVAEQRDWMIGFSKETEGARRGFGEGVIEPLLTWETVVEDSKSEACMVFSFHLSPTSSPDNISSLGPENMSPPPWSLVDFEQMVSTLTLHDPNIFGTQ